MIYDPHGKPLIEMFRWFVSGLSLYQTRDPEVVKAEMRRLCKCANLLAIQKRYPREWTRMSRVLLDIKWGYPGQIITLGETTSDDVNPGFIADLICWKWPAYAQEMLDDLDMRASRD